MSLNQKELDYLSDFAEEDLTDDDINRLLDKEQKEKQIGDLVENDFNEYEYVDVGDGTDELN